MKTSKNSTLIGKELIKKNQDRVPEGEIDEGVKTYKLPVAK